jgi:Ca2+-dependent lipid-binding protein
VNNIAESLILNLYDYNEHTKNTLLGSASFDLAVLAHDAIQEGLELPVLRDGKNRGDLRFDASYYPVMKEQAGEAKEILEEACVFPRL